MASDVSKKLQSQIATKFKPSHPSLTVMYTSNACENDLSVVEGTYRQLDYPTLCRPDNSGLPCTTPGMVSPDQSTVA